MNIFGPVPSRRLGQSLGVNNIPPKRCSYSCIYCQLGRTNKMQINRQTFYELQQLYNELSEKLDQLKSLGEKVDYITFVADGEPQLDINLGREIELFSSFGIKTAVICNASLIWDENVRDELSRADWVSLKVDSVDENVWEKIDRPHGGLKLSHILDGIKKFKEQYGGVLVTETMLVGGVNDSYACIESTAQFLSSIKPYRAYLLVPSRPPAENFARRPGRAVLLEACGIFEKYGLAVESITGDEGDSFVAVSDVINNILEITSVHPIKKQALEKLIRENDTGWEEIEKLLKSGELESYEYEDSTFYVKKIGKRGR